MSRRMTASIVFKVNDVDNNKEDFDEIEDMFVDALASSRIVTKGIVITYTFEGQGEE